MKKLAVASPRVAAPAISTAAASSSTPQAAAGPPPPPSGSRYPRAVRAWLILGLALIFVQVVVGGITRLTGSGLSITKWEIVTGTLPPLSPESWEAEFALYRDTPQYEKMNVGMSLSEFKFIYFWEYFHRLWARLMGFAFVLPLGYFLARGTIDRALGKRLGLVFASAALAASFGWIMVASGLIDRPLVNAYKLSVHLGIAFVTFGILQWTTLFAHGLRPTASPSPQLRRLVYWTFGLLVVQILLGGMMSGMRAALVYPTWPDIGGALVPEVLLDGANWTWANVVDYDRSPFMAALVHLLHRTSAYALTALVAALAWVGFRQNLGRAWRVTLSFVAGLTAWQVLLGIGTVLLSQGAIPVAWGVLHQAVALLLLASVLAAVWLARGGEGGKVVEGG